MGGERSRECLGRSLTGGQRQVKLEVKVTGAVRWRRRVGGVSSVTGRQVLGTWASWIFGCRVFRVARERFTMVKMPYTMRAA